MALPLIYDIGMNAGDDTEYYLKKGYRVIGIDANRGLCDHVSRRFSSVLATGRLMILNIAIGSHPGKAKFLLHRHNSLLSTLKPEPRLHGGMIGDDQWKMVDVDVRRLSDIIAVFGAADYIKIDVEGTEAVVLRDLARHDKMPRWISAEANEIATPCWLIAMGYRAFKLGAGVLPKELPGFDIATLGSGIVQHSFNDCSSGPFGNDIPGPWMSEREMLTAWMAHTSETGTWCDIHAWDGQTTGIGRREAKLSETQT
jgi:FkbM family methyltransferase